MEFSILLMFGLLISPILTIVNIYNLFAKKQFIPKVADSLIFSLGPICTVFLYYAWNPQNWQDPIILGDGFPFHEPITNYPTVLVLSVLAIIGYCILRIKKTSLPPLVIVLCTAAMYIGCALSVFWVIQLYPNLREAYAILPVEGLLMCLFPLNFIISTISLIRSMVKEMAVLPTKTHTSRFLNQCEKLLSKSYSLPVLAFIMMWPLLGLMISILILFGQQPDAIIKAFTQTSDWLFSLKVSPEPIYMDGHYLCTVAAGGHRKIVKPQRYGVRHGKQIIVNRQLCIANAFEDLIAERTPRFHRMVRRFYNRYGYPVSKHIQTPTAADITYMLMKPLEWLFLIFLYLFDIKPEDRIAMQYLPVRYQDIKSTEEPEMP